MHRRRPITRSMRIVPAVVVGSIIAASVTADLDEVIETGTDRIQLAQASQQAVDRVVGETERLESEYKQVMKQIDGLEVYNQHIERQIAHQQEELTALRQSIDQISTVERQIMPLMIRMLDGLEQFVELDMPFLRDERLERVERLRGVMERADVTVAEKFRRLMEAFQIENDFGRTIETYKATVVIQGATLEVNILRIGRIGLYYQTNDASATGMWDRNAGEWTPLTGRGARNQVRQGIKIARKLVAPDLLLLDISAPEVAP